VTMPYDHHASVRGSKVSSLPEGRPTGYTRRGDRGPRIEMTAILRYVKGLSTVTRTLIGQFGMSYENPLV